MTSRGKPVIASGRWYTTGPGLLEAIHVPCLWVEASCRFVDPRRAGIVFARTPGL
jgi:hypothetical protein